MSRWITTALLVAMATPLAAADKPLAHMVFFTLDENTAANRETLIKACYKHLTRHSGTLYFSAGARVADLKRDVNDLKFDVALHIVFASRKDHDTYQDHPRHLKFISENKALWKNVRVFDSHLPPPAADVLPAGARGFAGMIRGRVQQIGGGQIILSVSGVAKVWRTNKAETPRSIVGKRVTVTAPAGENLIRKYLGTLKAGDVVQLDVANREGSSLRVLELTEGQRERAKQ